MKSSKPKKKHTLARGLTNMTYKKSLRGVLKVLLTF